MAWLESVEQGLDGLVAVATLALEGISILCIVVGVFKTGQVSLALKRRYRGRLFPFNQVRLCFGSWLALALEFQLGSDILATTIAPTTQELTKLAVIAVIRTFLNYFLGKEMELELALERERLDQDHIRPL